MDIKKNSGIILHPTSLPGGVGIGDFGKNSYEFVDYLVETKTKVWQVLPLGPTDEIEYSPYSSPSSVLGNINLIDLTNLSSNEEIKIEDKIFNEKFVDYKKVYEYKKEYLRLSSKNIDIKEKEYQFFLEDITIRKHLTFLTLDQKNKVPWNKWIDSEYNYTEQLFEFVIKEFESDFKFNLFTQYEFYKQWFQLKEYANKSGIKILGDIPIYVNHNSADVWSDKSLFDLDENGEMSYVSGAVPDDFTVDGQIWNTALYNWENNRLGNYQYWISKLQNNLDKFDYLRIDHFVGFFQYWAIPINEKALNGEWRKGPWKNFFKEVSKNIPMSKLLAEDLGVILQETDQILKEYNIPGMKVLQQRIPSDVVNEEIHPHDWNQNIIAYTGTHDSPTIGQWFEESNDIQMRSFDEYKQKLKYSYSEDIWNFISLVWESPAILSVTTIQDVLNLGKSARFNVPGTKYDNWSWRLRNMQELDKTIDKLRELNKNNSRVN